MIVSNKSARCVIDGKTDRLSCVFDCRVFPSRENMRNTRFIKRNIILHNSFDLCNAIRSNENCVRISFV